MTNQEAFAEEIKTMNPYELARRLNQDCKFCPAWIIVMNIQRLKCVQKQLFIG